MARGFSLLELAIVVAVIGVMSAVALPGISSTVARTREDAEVARVEGFVTKARNLARRLNRCVDVERVGQDQLVFRTFGNASVPQCPTYPDADIESTLTVNSRLLRIDEVGGSGNPAGFRFLRDGGAAATADVTLPLGLRSSGRRKVVVVQPLLGFVRAR